MDREKDNGKFKALTLAARKDVLISGTRDHPE